MARHPRSLLASEQLAAFLGYSVNDIAASLDSLIEAGLITRTSSSAHAARLYRLHDGGPGHGWLPPLLEFTSTRNGRLAMIAALRRRSAHRSAGRAEAPSTPELLVFDPAVRHRGASRARADAGQPKGEADSGTNPRWVMRRSADGRRRRGSAS